LVLPGTPTCTIDDIKQKVKGIRKVDCNQQKVIYHGQQLEGNCLLSDYNIQNNAELKIVLKGICMNDLVIVS